MGLFAIIACAPTGPTSVDTAADKAAIRSADKAHIDAFNAGDVNTIVAGYAEDAVVMPSDAPAVSGREAIRKMFAESIVSAKAGGLTESLGDYTSVVSGNVGWSAGTAVCGGSQFRAQLIPNASAEATPSMWRFGHLARRLRLRFPEVSQEISTTTLQHLIRQRRSRLGNRTG
jgi:ketosteroid isomerase-like protein